MLWVERGWRDSHLWRLLPLLPPLGPWPMSRSAKGHECVGHGEGLGVAFDGGGLWELIDVSTGMPEPIAGSRGSAGWNRQACSAGRLRSPRVRREGDVGHLGEGLLAELAPPS